MPQIVTNYMQDRHSKQCQTRPVKTSCSNWLRRVRRATRHIKIRRVALATSSSWGGRVLDIGCAVGAAGRSILHPLAARRMTPYDSHDPNSAWWWDVIQMYSHFLSLQTCISLYTIVCLFVYRYDYVCICICIYSVYTCFFSSRPFYSCGDNVSCPLCSWCCSCPVIVLDAAKAVRMV